MLCSRAPSFCKTNSSANVQIRTQAVFNVSLKGSNFSQAKPVNVLQSLPWSTQIQVSRRGMATGPSNIKKGPTGEDGVQFRAGQTLMEYENNRVVAVADAPPEEIKLDLANNLLKEEIQIVDDFEELSFHNAIGKRFLQDSKFKFVDQGDGHATLTKSDGNHDIRLTFKTYKQEQEENEEEADTEGNEEEAYEAGEYEGAGEGEGEHTIEVGRGKNVIDARTDSNVGQQQGKGGKVKRAQQQEEEEGEPLDVGEIKSVSDVKEGIPEEGEPLPKRQDFVADIEFMKKGKVKGTWRLYCFSGHQNRLYIDQMEVIDGAVEQPKNLEETFFNLAHGEVKAYPFDTLTVETQDRIYDLMDKLGLDDQVSHFVKQYVIRKKSQNETLFLNRLRELLVSTLPPEVVNKQQQQQQQQAQPKQNK